MNTYFISIVSFQEADCFLIMALTFGLFYETIATMKNTREKEIIMKSVSTKEDYTIFYTDIIGEDINTVSFKAYDSKDAIKVFHEYYGKSYTVIQVMNGLLKG